MRAFSLRWQLWPHMGLGLLSPMSMATQLHKQVNHLTSPLLTMQTMWRLQYYYNKINHSVLSTYSPFSHSIGIPLYTWNVCIIHYTIAIVVHTTPLHIIYRIINA